MWGSRFLPCAIGEALVLLGAGTAAAQQGIEMSYGGWWHGSRADLYAVAVSRPFLGPFSWSLGGYHLADRRSVPDRTQTGGEVTVAVARDGSGLYALGTAGLGIRHDDGNLDGSWSVGAGWSFTLLPVLSLALETRYRWEDEGVRGFWRLNPSDRHGLVILGRVAIGRAPPRGSAPPRGRPPPASRPPLSTIEREAAASGASSEAASVAVQVVQTALDAMGTPYRWGGADGNGYDCSGLIQWAYAEHGVLLPRVSRDQARIGLLVPKEPSSLRPADILAFSESGVGVSHVGLYVGEGRFIHSTSTGVRLTSLLANDPDSRWWRDRWISTRRILN
jgi:cell wall-associated NlpC family hydrolase